MKEHTINKRFWILIITTNSFVALILLSLVFNNYELIAGFLAGFFSLMIYLLINNQLFKKMFTKQNLAIKRKATYTVLLFLLISLMMFLIISLFFLINYFCKKHINENKNLFLWPINFITFSFPFLVFIVALAIDASLNKKKELGKE